jgi:low temperature requirement protein LtrA
VDGALVLAAVLGLALSACLWWAYFEGAEEPAAEALAALPPVERAQAALDAFGYAHLPILLGIVTTAAAVRRGFSHPFAQLEWRVAALLGGGVAVFLAGDAISRRVLGLVHAHVRFATAVIAAATIPLGALVSPVAQTAALVAVLVASFQIGRS